MSRFALLHALALSAALVLAPAALAQTRIFSPPPAGTDASGITTQDAEWRDIARERNVPARIYLPPVGTGAQRAPLVVFSHGMGGSRFGYSHIGRHLAANGFVAVHVQHAGSDRSVWTGNMLSLIGSLQEAASDTNALARAQDVSFAISRVLDDAALAARIDASRIAVAGHSYGANTAMLLSGAAVERDGKRVNVADPRVRAAILLSAPPFYGEADQAAVLRDVRVPTLHITGTADLIRIPGYRSEPADRIAVFDALSGPKYLAVFEGGEHSVFTDRTRSELALAIKAATRDLCVAFLKTALAAEPRAIEEALATHRSLLAPPERIAPRPQDFGSAAGA
ncbi:MAG: alpha/beta hydrolase family protein [Burkholderiales bacterium]